MLPDPTMMRRQIQILVNTMLLLISAVGNAQPYPQNYFTAPMDTPIYLSAPFGSLRENHFHSGMDIRTNEREGLPIYAVADGYVSRIKISPIGYGKAVYIDHPNGYTSVYGHLLKFEGDLATYIKDYQYSIQRFDFDHFPDKQRISVKKGQLIGYSGNTGGSTGPHLHFEIRDTKSEEPINPLLFGIAAVDSLPPFINRLIFYQLNENRPHPIAQVTIPLKRPLQTDSGWVLMDTIAVCPGKIGVGIETYDHLINKSKEYSVYCADLFANNRRQFSYRLERINFADSRYINAHIDYETYKQEGYRINKCFLDDGNRIAIYPYMRNRGQLLVGKDSCVTIHICVGDVYGNTYTLYAIAKASLPETFHESACNELVWFPQQRNTFKSRTLQLSIPPGALYDTLYPCINQDVIKGRQLLSPAHQVHQHTTPLHKTINISIKPDSVPFSDKLLLAAVSRDGSIKAAGGTFEQGWVTLQTTTFGTYAVVADTIAPIARLTNTNKKGEITDTCMLIHAQDILSGIDKYTATLNGSWILLEFDPKNDLLRYDTDEKTIWNQKQELVLTVTDKKNNTTVLKQYITFKH